MNLSVISKKVSQFPVLFVCGLLIPLVGVLLFMRGPKVSQFEEQLSDLEREWRNIDTNLERSANLENDIEALEAGLSEIRSRLMQVDEVAGNYEFFYNLEREAGVTLRQFSQGTASDGEGLPVGKENLHYFSVIPYDISMRGTLVQILGFLDLLERQSYIVRLDLLNISRPTDVPEDTGLLNARLRCHVLAAKHE